MSGQTPLRCPGCAGHLAVDFDYGEVDGFLCDGCGATWDLSGNPTPPPDPCDHEYNGSDLTGWSPCLWCGENPPARASDDTQPHKIAPVSPNASDQPPAARP